MEHALNNLRQALREAAAKLGLPAFWRWWMGELASLTPAAPKTALQRRRLRPILAFGDDVAVLWEPRVVDGALALAETARVPLGGDAAAVAQAGRGLVEALPRRASGGGAAKVVIALPRAVVLRKQFALPAAVEENLKEAIGYDLDRHTPFRADQLYFDAVVISRDLAKKEIRVDWAAALRTTVDAARRHAESWGALVVGVTPESPEAWVGAAAPPARWTKLNLLPDEERSEIVFWRRPGFLLPAALLALLTLVAIALPIWQKRDYVIALTDTTEHARVQAAASDALRQELDQATGDYNFALGKKYAYPSTVQLLDDVTKILPDDTWLTQLEVKSMPKGKEPHREITLRGESGNAGRLVSALEESKLVEQAAPRSPTTKIQPGPGEVFDLGAQLKPLPPPALVQLEASAPAAAAPRSADPSPPPAATTADPVAPAAPTAAAAANGAPPPAVETRAASEAGAPAPGTPIAPPPPAATASPGPRVPAATEPAAAAPSPRARTPSRRTGVQPTNGGAPTAASRTPLPPGAVAPPAARPAPPPPDPGDAEADAETTPAGEEKE